MDKRRTSEARPLFANAGLVTRLFGLSSYDLKTLRENGTVHARKATEKRWLYRVPDIVRYLESGGDGVVRDKEYEEDLAWIEEQLKKDRE